MHDKPNINTNPYQSNQHPHYKQTVSILSSDYAAHKFNIT